MCIDGQNESAGHREAWSVRSTYKVKGIRAEGRAITVRRSETQMVMKTGELNENAMELSITY
jgi:hypothetical protein